MVQKIKFQWFFDFATSPDSMQIITVRAGGDSIVRRLKPFFAAYKYYKLGSVKCSFVPASTLPVDPTGLSYEAGENPTVDPRDQLTPGMTRITNGEDFIDDISGLSADDQTRLYNSMMMDPRWYKWSLQSGLKRSAYPKFWQIGQLHQDYFPGATINLPHLGSDGRLVGTDCDNLYDPSTVTSGTHANRTGHIDVNTSGPRGLFQTGHKGKLGWMPTDALAHYANAEGTQDMTTVAPIPCIELFKVLLPRAYRTKYYYRVYVTETVYFSQPVTVPGASIGLSNPTFLMGLDRFLNPGNITPTGPANDHMLQGPVVTVNSPGLLPPNDGGESISNR